MLRRAPCRTSTRALSRTSWKTLCRAPHHRGGRRRCSTADLRGRGSALRLSGADYFCTGPSPDRWPYEVAPRVASQVALRVALRVSPRVAPRVAAGSSPRTSPLGPLTWRTWGPPRSSGYADYFPGASSAQRRGNLRSQRAPLCALGEPAGAHPLPVGAGPRARGRRLAPGRAWRADPAHGVSGLSGPSLRGRARWARVPRPPAETPAPDRARSSRRLARAEWAGPRNWAQ